MILAKIIIPNALKFKQMKTYLEILMIVFILPIASCTEEDNENENEDLVDTTLTLSSIAAVDGELLEDYKCEEKVDNIENSISLTWSGLPDGT